MVLWGLQKASAGISFDAMVVGIRATSPTALLGSLAATFLSFVALLGYDISGLRYTGARPPLTAALLASFCGFGIGLATITALGLVLRAEEVSRLLGAPPEPLRSAAAVILASATAFLSFCALRRKPLRLGPVEFTPPGAHLVLMQI